MVLVKNLKFLFSSLLGTFLLEKVFGDVLYRKLAFFDHKNIDLKKSQNLRFSKGVSPRFWSKISNCFFFQANLAYKHFLAAFQIENQPFLTIIILLHEKFLQFDGLRAVVFQLNLKYPHVKITNLLLVVVKTNNSMICT